MAVHATVPPGMTLFVDENLGPDIVRFLGRRGHAAVVLPKRIADVAILGEADARGGIVVTSDRDFPRLITRNVARDAGRYPRAGLIVVSGDDRVALSRLEQLIDLIEFLHAMLQTSADARLIIDIREHTIWIDL